MKKRILSALLVGIIALTTVSGCGSSSVVVDFEEIFFIEFEGNNGYGQVAVGFTLNDVAIVAADGKDSKLSTAFEFEDSVELKVEFEDSVEVTYEAPNLYEASGNLKNGDKIYVEVSYDVNLAKKLKLDIKNAKFTVTVEGLE